jgi:hypothetical protein
MPCGHAAEHVPELAQSVPEAIERTARDNAAVFFANAPEPHADRLRLNLHVASASLPSAEPGPEAASVTTTSAAESPWSIENPPTVREEIVVDVSASCRRTCRRGSSCSSRTPRTLAVEWVPCKPRCAPHRDRGDDRRVVSRPADAGRLRLGGRQVRAVASPRPARSPSRGAPRAGVVRTSAHSGRRAARRSGRAPAPIAPR